MVDGAKDANVAQAEKNLMRKPEIDDLQRELHAMVAELSGLKRLYDEKLYIQKSALQKNSPQMLLGMLQTETKQLDGESEKKFDRFMDGEVPLKEFLSSYMDQRILYHTRAAKLEAMKNQ